MILQHHENTWGHYKVQRYREVASPRLKYLMDFPDSLLMSIDSSIAMSEHKPSRLVWVARQLSPEMPGHLMTKLCRPIISTRRELVQPQIEL
jgi:hypothetical protein